MLTDHINFNGRQPAARTAVAAPANVLFDLTRVMTDLNALLQKAARQAKLQLRSGVYLAVAGPATNAGRNPRFCAALARTPLA